MIDANKTTESQQMKAAPGASELSTKASARLPAPPRVTILCFYYYPQAGGGADRLMQRVAESLVGDGWRMTVLTQTIKGLPRQESINGVVVRRTAVWRAPGMRFLSYMASAFSSELFRRDAGQVIHLNQMYLHVPLALWLRRLRGGKVVVRVACGGPHGDLARLKGLPFGLGRWVLRAARRADAIISLTGQITEELCEAGFSRECLVQIANGIDSARFAPALPEQRDELRRQLGLPQDCPIALFAGRLESQKAADVLLRAWKQVHAHQPEALLLLAGDGSLRTELEALSRSLRIQDAVRFLGQTDHMLAWYQSADLFVLPSWSEGMSNALLEAMACGLMPAATAIPGTTEVVTHEREGLLVTPGSETELAAALERAISDEALRATLSAAARQRILDHFAIEEVVRHYAEVYQQAAAGVEVNSSRDRKAGIA